MTQRKVCTPTDRGRKNTSRTLTKEDEQRRGGTQQSKGPSGPWVSSYSLSPKTNDPPKKKNSNMMSLIIG